MIKNLIWHKSTEFSSIEEENAFKKALRTEKGDMEIDIDRIDEREKNTISCYRSELLLTSGEYEAMSNEILFDFSENKYIIRCSFFVNGYKIGTTYCFGNEQKYVMPKKNLKPGKNNIFILIELAPGVLIWNNGTPADTYFPDGYVSEFKSLPTNVKISNFNICFEATSANVAEHGAVINFKNKSSMKITIYENGVYRFKYPIDAPNIMDEVCTDELSENLSEIDPENVEILNESMLIKTKFNNIKIIFSPFAAEIYDLNGKLIYKYAACISDNNVTLIKADLEKNEHIFGLGENTNPTLDKRGQIEDIWVIHDFDKCDIPVPYYISTKGYGLYLNTSRHSVFDMGKTIQDKALVYVYDRTFDLFFLNGPEPEKIVSSYAGITGIAPLPPKWAFGFWQAGNGVCTQKGAENIIVNYNKYGIPLDVIGIDPGWQRGCSCDLEWSAERFPEKDNFLKELKDEEINLILWMVPFINDAAESYELHRSEGNTLKTDNGEPKHIMYWKCANALALDFESEGALKWLDKKIGKLVRDGASGMKIDGGDGAEIPFNIINCKGKDGKEIHNLYPLYFAKAIRSILEKHRPGKRIVTWQRSSYVGAGRYPCTWGGDQFAEFKHLKVLLKAGQACGLMNIPFWSEDVGGFCLTPKTDEEFFIRSYQWGCIAPLSRAHGGKTEPWAYGDRALKITKKYIHLRYLLMPYTYSNAYEAHLYSRPIMVPLFFYNLNDKSTYSKDYQYYYGKSIMVAPAYDTMEREDMSFDIEIYFPEGSWLDFNTGKTYMGGKSVTYTAAIDILPMFIKMGSIIPFAKKVTNTKHYNPAELNIRFYPAENTSSFVFYDDAGEGLEYKNGVYNSIEFSCKKISHTIDISIKTIKKDYDSNYTGNYSFIVYCSEKPESIMVNGKNKSFTYNEETKEALLDICYNI